MGRKGPGIRTASATSIEIDWYYRGVRCRERLKLPPTPRNLRYAENLLGEIRTAIARGTFDYLRTFPDSKRGRAMAPNPGALVSIGRLLDQWLTAKKPEIEHSTYIEYERAIRCQLGPPFGSLALKDLTRQLVRAWVADCPSGAKFINNTLGPMRQMLSEALDDGLIDVNPLQDFRVKKKRDVVAVSEIDPFSPEEIRAILAQCSGQIANLVQFAFWSGLRSSELIALRWSDVDLAGGFVRVSAAFVRGQAKAPKTEAGARMVKLLQPAQEALQAQRAHTQLKGGVVFENPRSAQAWRSERAFRENDWTRALERAEVRYRYPYQTRHTFASVLLSAGENPLWVAGQLGHKDVAVTMRKYARWIPSVQPDAGDKALGVWERSRA